MYSLGFFFIYLFTNLLDEEQDSLKLEDKYLDPCFFSAPNTKPVLGSEYEAIHRGPHVEMPGYAEVSLKRGSVKVNSEYRDFTINGNIASDTRSDSVSANIESEYEKPVFFFQHDKEYADFSSDA